MTANSNKNFTTVSSTSANESLENIKQDIYTLKSDVIELGRTVKSESLKKIEEAVTEIQDKIENVKREGNEEMDKVQSYIKSNPTQSVGIAFAAGVLLTLLMRRG